MRANFFWSAIVFGGKNERGARESSSLSYLFNPRRLNTITPSPKPEIASETILWNLVKLFGSTNESGLRQRCSKLIQSLTMWQPELRDSVNARRAALDHAVNGELSIIDKARERF